MARPIRWLHLSDLHYGCPGKELWELVEDELFRDLDAQLDRLGTPDLLLFTGDLAHSGADAEYAQVDAFLDDLLRRLTRSGAAEPLLVPVPGNHDVAWPTGRAALLYRILRSFDGTVDDPEVAEIHEELWKKRDASFIDGLFPGYRPWFERRVRPQLEARARTVHFSHFPCDFTAVVEPADAFPLTIVGLNSTWLQYAAGDFEGKLLVPIEQLRAALAPAGVRKPYAPVDGGKPSLLLMHQPPDWLNDRGQEIFDADVYPGGRFFLCLYGHMHEAESRRTATYGGRDRCFFQAPSLFGLEKWGRSDEDRRMGYSFGEIREDGEIRVWPREGKARGDGSRSFGFDGRFHPDHEDPESAVIRRVGPASRSAPPARPERVAAAELDAYLRELRASVTHLELRGLSVDDQQQAANPLLAQLYTPLRGRDGGDLRSLMRGREERPHLEELLSRGPRILVEGPPGCGKSTFLRHVTSLLLVPALGERVDESHSRSARRLRIGTPVPVLLRLEGLGRALAWEGKPADRERLLDLLELDCRARELGFDRGAWRERLEDGRACLLLDGLDEVTAAALRAGVLEVLEDASKSWRARMVVASRPFLTEGLTNAGFLKLEVAPFDDDDVRRFLDKWVAMLDEEDPEKARTGARKEYRRTLETAILRPDIRRLARSPMMLTCLCLVHWSRGELPRGRAKVYQAVLKWLLEASGKRRRELFGLSEAGAYEALDDGPRRRGGRGGSGL
jgi:energy-coupling factor transporter ATP-binding protein EcfA2